MMKVLVSACLLGENCKYSGGNNYSEKVATFIADKTVIPVCPEVLGGLPVPWDVDELCCRAKKIGLEALHLDLGSGDDGYALTRPENQQAWLERAAHHGLRIASLALNDLCGHGFTAGLRIKSKPHRRSAVRFFLSFGYVFFCRKKRPQAP